jgi:Arc/MetJ-type ribon-helix-helix transcriptional regulator
LQLKNSERTVLANIDKSLVEWIDGQVQIGNFSDRSQLIKSALLNTKESKNKRVK